MTAGRQTLRVVTAGHVDHGKSTVIGRLLAETGALPEGKLEQIKSYCAKNSKPFEYAFLLDALKDEQSQGITIDSARIFFKTVARDYILIDAPGHVEFLKNMVTGAAHAAAALLVIDAKEGVRENSRRHGYLLSMLGIRQIAVLINKMDLADYEEAKYEALKAEYDAFLGRLGVRATHFIPVAGFHGDNIASRSEKMPWYKGPSVLQAIEGFQAERPEIDKAFRMPVQDVYKFTARGDDRRIVAGTIDSGSVAPGDEVVFYPSGKSSRVASIETFPAKTVERAFAGSATGLRLVDQLYIGRGEIAAVKMQDAPAVSSRLRANLFWLGRSPLVVGKSYVLKLAAARATARLESIERVLDASTLAEKRGTAGVERHEVATCLLSLDRPIACDTTEEHRATGRFILVDDYEISGGGIVLETLAARTDWVQEKVQLRNAKWQRSDISVDERQARFKHRPGLLLITGRRDSKRKEIARAVERALFEAGRLTYFLAIGSVLYGVDADLRASSNHPEDVRRLAELGFIMLDAGMLLVVTANELAEDDVAILSAAIEPERLLTVWAGEGQPTCQAVKVDDSDAQAAVDRILQAMAERSWIGPKK